MQYSDFLTSLKSSLPNWYLTDWLSAVRIALGGRGLATFCAAFTILLTPSMLLMIYSVYSSKPVYLILVVLSLWGFWTSSTAPSGIGISANLIIAIVGLVCAIMLRDRLLGLAVFLPGLTWLGSCASLGATASYLIEALQKSESTFQTLVNRGILKTFVDSDDGHTHRTGH